MGKFVDITGQTFGEWQATKYIGKSYWKCKNIITNEEKDIHGYSLKTKYSGIINKGKMPEGILNEQFGNWKAIEYIGGGFWNCICKCGDIHRVNGKTLKDGLSTMCNKCRYKGKLIDLMGQTFGEWKVLEYVGNGYWRCKCSCSGGTIKDIHGRHLRSGASYSCGCKQNRHTIRKDITGKRFNSLEVIRYTGENNMWECKCSCGNTKVIHRDSIVTGKTKSCGCQKEKRRVETLLERYGDTNTTRIDNPRELWQIEAASNKEKFIEFLNLINNDKNIVTISDMLDINITSAAKIVRKFGVEDIIKPHSGESALEIDVRNYIKSITTSEIVIHNRELIGTEIDIYLPEFKIAIEVNGTYWHSSIFKDTKYHQNKSIQAAKRGIHLIHIFEHEWKTTKLKCIIQRYIADIIMNDSKKVFARDTIIKQVDTSECKEFLDSYHLQGNIPYKLSLGCYTKDGELLGVMTFGKPRFNTKYEWELLRLAWKPGYMVVGGAEKLISNFKKQNNPQSIVSYCDISKFTGNVYIRLGFEADINSITQPNYVWVDKNNVMLNRYQTTKKSLISQKLGNKEQTEDEIMETLGYFKVYNSGNIRFTWYK